MFILQRVNGCDVIFGLLCDPGVCPELHTVILTIESSTTPRLLAIPSRNGPRARPARGLEQYPSRRHRLSPGRVTRTGPTGGIEGARFFGGGQTMGLRVGRA